MSGNKIVDAVIYLFFAGGIAVGGYLLICLRNLVLAGRAELKKNEELEATTQIAECGHLATLRKEMTIFGHIGMVNLSIDKDGKVKYCHDCLAEYVRQCFFCELPILPGSEITLCDYEPWMGNQVEQLKLKDVPPQVLACNYPSCLHYYAELPDGHLGYNELILPKGKKIPLPAQPK